MRSRIFLISILLIVSLSANLSAQQAQRPLNETGWLLEITYLKGEPPVYERVRLPGSKMPGDWFTSFAKVEGWQLPAGAQPIRAVRISNRLRKDATIRVTVSVIRGEKHQDAEETVATYELRENETISVDALKDFGIEPIEIRAVRTQPLPANLPEVVNKIPSVEVVGIRALASDLPEYQITLRNVSLKAIEALNVDLMVGQRRVSHGMPQGLEGRPLVPAGEIVEVQLPLIVNSDRSEGSFTPTVPVEQKFIINLALFADGTSEGFAERTTPSGAGFQSVKFGRRLALQRALPLFAAALESSDIASPAAIRRFQSALEGINVGIADSDLAQLLQRFPTDDPTALRPGVEVGIHFMRKQILDELRRIQLRSHEIDFRSWLNDNKERYTNWLARLETGASTQP